MFKRIAIVTVLTLAMAGCGNELEETKARLTSTLKENETLSKTVDSINAELKDKLNAALKQNESLQAANDQIAFLNNQLEKIKLQRDNFQAQANAKADTQQLQAANDQIALLNNQLEKIKLQRDNFQAQVNAGT
ncbi:MAG: hypothetical protein ACNYPI_08205 [Arenicellales bacterium WSBS_2016_MAG_OTU3]